MNHTERRARALRAAVEIYTGGVPLSQHFAQIIAASDASAGYVLVPREATEAMCNAAILKEPHGDGFDRIWAAMIAAAKEMEG
jgi:hypothetical protein